MKRRTLLWALAALNAVLVVGLAWKLGGENAAHAQVRARGEYILVPAELANATSGVVYIIDTRNGLLGAYIYDHNRQDLSTMPPIPLNRVFEAAVGGRR